MQRCRGCGEHIEIDERYEHVWSRHRVAACAVANNDGCLDELFDPITPAWES